LYRCFMPEQIVYRIKMERPPTLADRQKMVGLDGFAKKLEENSWVDENGIALRKMKTCYTGHSGGKRGGHYIEWSAVLDEE